MHTGSFATQPGEVFSWRRRNHCAHISNWQPVWEVLLSILLWFVFHVQISTCWSEALQEVLLSPFSFHLFPGASQAQRVVGIGEKEPWVRGEK